MAKEFSTEEMHKALFTNLVMMLGSSAMQQMGKLVNPLTNETETNLEGAQITIDMIEMLKVKTTGNLDEDENKLLGDLLASLQMNYVETAKSAPKTGAPKTDEAETKTHETPEIAKDAKQAPAAEKKDPKFHKSYGQ